MGKVLKAIETATGRLVAIKSALDDGPSRDALAREAALLIAMPPQAHVVEAIALEREGGRAFLVCEFLGGGSLAERLEHGPLPERDAFMVALGVARALAAVQAAHGDLSPSNVLFDADGTVKVADFGLSFRQGGNRSAAPKGSGESIARARASGGTPGFASPEALSGAPASVESDAWSFGAILSATFSPDALASGELGGLVRELLDPDPSARPSDFRAIAETRLARAMRSRGFDVPPEPRADTLAIASARRRADSLARLAAERFESGATDEAREAASLAREAYGATSCSRGLAAVACVEADIAARTGDATLERELLERALRDAGNDGESRAPLLKRLGNARYAAKDLDGAEAMYLESLALSQALGDPLLTAQNLHNLGGVELSRGNLGAAEKAYRKAAKFAHAHGLSEQEAYTAINLARVLSRRGKTRVAERWLSKAAESSRERGAESLRSAATVNLGVALMRAGDFTAAAAALREAIDVKRAIGDTIGEIRCLANLGACYLDSGYPERALEFASEARAKYLAAGSPDSLGSVENVYASARLAIGDHRGAAQAVSAWLARRASALANGSAPSEQEGYAHGTLAEALRVGGDAGWRAEADAAVECARESANPYALAQALLIRAEGAISAARTAGIPAEAAKVALDDTTRALAISRRFKYHLLSRAKAALELANGLLGDGGPDGR
jgi:tetratricopeptide (TPR) repeat protein